MKHEIVFGVTEHSSWETGNHVHLQHLS